MNAEKDYSNAIVEMLVYLKYLFSTVFSPTLLKSFGAGFYITFAYLFDIKMVSTLLALFILVLLDFISGISASVYNKQAIRSSKIKHTAIKMTAYFSVISGAHLAELGLLSQFQIIDDTVIAFFLLTELISLLENVGRMGIDTPKGLIQKLVDYKNKS